MLIKTFIIPVLLLLFTVTVESQSTFNKHISWWPAYQLRINLDEKWSVVNDVQLRNFAVEPLLGLIAVRTGVNYRLSKYWIVGGGGTWFHQQQFNVTKQKVISDELRAWEEIRNERQYGRWQVGHRFRTEQRYFTGESGLSHRFRYKLDFQYRLSVKWKAIGGNELMWQTSREKSDWDQNRTWLGTEYALNEKRQVQVSFMNWWQANRNIHQPVVRINFIQTIN